MNVSDYILDALGKFWTRLKSTYVTNCASTSNSLALAASQGKALQDQITALNANSYLLSYGTEIVANTNLDNIKAIGSYYCAWDSAAQTLTNCPVSNAFTMKVENANGNGYTRQTLRVYHGEGNYYTRYMSNNAWGGWTKCPTRSELNATVKNITRNGTTFTATKTDGSTFTFTQQDNNTTYSAGTGLSLSGTTFNVTTPITNITRSGTTFTATRANGTTFTFTQQDNNTTYSDATTSAHGLMTAAMVTKLNGIAAGANNVILRSGSVTVSGVPVNGYKDVTITYSGFSQRPFVLTQIHSGSGAYQYANMTVVCATTPTTTSTKLRVFHGADTEARTPVIEWLAVSW